PPPVRRDGPRRLLRPDRGERGGRAHQLRRLPGRSARAGPDGRGEDRRTLLVELRPRRRALAGRLRLPRGPPRLAPALAGAAPGGPRLASRGRRPPLRGAGE